MRTHNFFSRAGLLCIFVLMFASACSDRNPAFGKWKMKAENHEYALTDEDAQMLGEEFMLEVKRVGESPKYIEPKLRAYSVKVIESGFAFLQSRNYTVEGTKYEDIEWGWKIVLENRSQRGISAYSGYSLFDKDGFILTSTKHKKGIDVLIKPGERGIIQGRTHWGMMAESKPYPPSRVHRGDYHLSLGLWVGWEN